MTEVSSWSPTDASNNLTPPDGWPEGMQPSGVNDVGRMMMGAIRRWYNTVSAGIANCLPLSGGSLTGALSVPYLSSTGAIGAAGDITTSGDVGARSVYANQNINATGSITAGVNLTGAFISSTGAINASGNVTVNGSVTAGASLTGAFISSTGDINASGNINVNGSIITANNLTASFISSAGGINASGAIAANGNLSSNGNLNVLHEADIGGSLTIHGSLNTLGSATIGNALTVNAVVDTTHYDINGWVFAYRTTDGAGTAHVICDATSTPAIAMYGANGTYYRADNGHMFTNRNATLNICRFQATDGNCINASGLWNNVSDAATKEAVEPYRAGLAEALRIAPVSYRYISGANPFAIDGQTYYGLVAQEVEQVVPEMVGRTEEGLATVAPGHLVFVLINAVKELEARLAQVENRGG